MTNAEHVTPLLRVVAALAAMGLLAACSGDADGNETPRATVPEASTTTTTSIDVTTVPDHIDVAYVQAVMDELDTILGDAIRELVANKVPNQRFNQLLDAVYDQPALEEATASFGRDAARGLEDYRPDARGPTTRVRSLVDSSDNCIVAAVDRDYAPLYRESNPDNRGYVQLRLKRPESDPAGANSTVWTLVAAVGADGAAIPEDPCK